MNHSSPNFFFAPDALAGRVAVVTGGSSGIGLATVELLLDCGAAVALCGRDAQRLEQAVAGLRAKRADAKLFARTCDVLDPNAVRSFAFGEWATILDTNAARVYQRVLGTRGDRRRPRVARRLWSLAAAVTPRRRVYDFNQAIMDLGATVCVARKPRCGVCPLRRMCRSVRA